MPAEMIMSQEYIDAHPAEWLDKRREGLAASEMAAVTGLAPPLWGSAFDLYHSKLNGWTTEQTESMAWGHFAEPWIADRFKQTHPGLDLTAGGLYRNTERRWQMATYDRLAFDGEAIHDGGGREYIPPLGPVQLKTQMFLGDDWGEPGSASIPVHYRIQVLCEMDCGDFDIAWLPVMDSGHKVVTYEIPRDAEADKDIEYLRQAAEEFLDRLATGREPDVDWTPATSRALKRLHPELEDRQVAIPVGLARRYKRAIAAEKRAGERKKLAANQIMQRMGSAKYAVVAGLTDDRGRPVKLATRSIYDQDSYTVPARKVDKITPGRWTP